MKKNLLLILLSLFCLGSNISANSTPDKGAYGSLSFLYWEEEVVGNSTYSQADFIQEYKLGYRGNVYSPRFLDYTVEGKIKYEDLENRSASTTTKSTSDSKDYKVNLKFIKDSTFPLTLYANKGENPITRVDTSSTFSYLYDTKNVGMNGSMLFDMFTITYGASDSQSSSKTLDYTQYLYTDTHYAGFRHSGKEYELSLNYRHFNQKVNREDTIADIEILDRYNTDQLDDSVDMRYRHNLSKTLTLNSYASYIESDFMSLFSKTTNANIDLRWKPTSKLNGSVRIAGTRLETIYDANETNTSSGVFDTYSLNQYVNYEIMPALIFTQSYSQYIYENRLVDGSIANYRVGLRHLFQTILTTDTTFKVNTNLDAQKIDTVTTSEDGNDSSSSINRYTLTVSAGILEQLPLLSSSLRWNVDYYNMLTSTDEALQRYGTNFSLLSNFLYIFRNNFSAAYSTSDMTNLRYDTLTTEYTAIDSTSTSIDVSESLDFSLRLGINGKMSFLAGIKYSNITNNDSSIKRLQPLADIRINYRIGRHLLLNANAHADRDLTYNYTNYRGESGLLYRVGKTSFSLGYKYNQTLYDGDSLYTDYGRSRFDAKLIRRF